MQGYTFRDTVTRNEKGVANLISEKIYQKKIEPGTTIEKTIEFFSLFNDPGDYTWNDLYKFIRDSYTKRIYEPTETELLESYETLGTSAIGDPVEGLKQVIPNIWTGFRESVKKLFADLWKFITDEIMGLTPERFNQFLDNLEGKKLIDKETRQGLTDQLNNFPSFQPVIVLLTILALIKTFIGVFISAVGGTLMKRLNAQHTPNVPSPDSVIRAAFLDPTLQDKVRKAMSENGLSKEDQDLMFAAQYFTFDPQTIGELRLRGFIDDATMNKYFDDLGFTPERRANFIKLLDRLPPLADIATMMAKEAFEPDQVARMGLDRELPGEFIQYSAQQGLNPEWARKYWIAHWQQPGLEMMFDAYHRRLIDEDFLKVFMKTVEIPPYLRDILIQLAYTPLTRVDIRRMYEDGVLDEQAVYNAYLDHGYSPENALLMLQWTIRYAEPAEKDLSKTQILNLYIDGQINRTDTVAMLVRIGFPEHRAELLIVYAEYEEIKKLQDEQQDNIELLYKENWIDKATARIELSKIDISSERISILLQRWDVKKTVSTKAPSKTDLDKFLRNGIIDEVTYKAEMQRAGYSARYIDWYYRLVSQGE